MQCNAIWTKMLPHAHFSSESGLVLYILEMYMFINIYINYTALWNT